jgi:hypothetical protein
MTMEKRDLLIHYDEERGELIFHSVPTDGTIELRAKSFDGVRPEVSYFKELSPDEAEQALGRLVFSLVDLNSSKKIGVRDYKAEADAAHVEYVAELEEQVKTGDVEAMFHLSQAMHDSAMSNYSLADMHSAESLLTTAAQRGHEGAKERLQSWPVFRAAIERRIARGKPV